MSVSQWKDIGGIHALHEQFEQRPSNPLLDGQFFVNARSAFFSLVKHKNPNKVWIPSYICSSMMMNGASLYSVEKCVSNASFVDDVSCGDLVLLVAYFGFNPDPNLIAKIKQKKAIVVVDSAHSFLSPKTESDYTIYSFTKLLGVPDGGMLCPGLPVRLKEPPSEWLEESMAIRQKQKDWYLRYLSFKKASVPIGEYTASKFTQNVVLNFVDYKFIKEAQVSNYKKLDSRFESVMSWQEDAVPIGFPMMISNRDKVRSELIANKIYPPVHWELNGNLDSSKMITIPCDWRCEDSDVERISSCLLKILS